MHSILVTGGAGFIGSHLVDELLAHGYDVRVLDSPAGQVHGCAKRPPYLNRHAERRIGDVRDSDALCGALEGIDAVVHLAARVGVGQSMYEITEYVGANSLGTAILLQELLDRLAQKLVVASSMSIYGEGSTAPVEAVERRREDLEARRFEPFGAGGERPPEVALEDGMAELAEWLVTQQADDRVDHATQELLARGLAR
jgi:dTDP-L-rhamnose 4-epimerase